ncbi:MgtC/SapB family protein [Aquabacterium sp.]|uniref:MgtC/SapB family protein n=1 Tax=Aquabacterium sp. TaxID=1872578 RepID=UPI0035B007B8
MLIEMGSSMPMGLAVALGCGLLIGVERERRKGMGQNRAFAGMRTFTLAALTGALAQLSGYGWLVALGGLLVLLLALLSYWRDKSDDPGVTTEMALFVTYVLGVVSTEHPGVASAMGVVITFLLAARASLHRFSTELLTEEELRSALVLAGAVLVVLPLIPDQPLPMLSQVNPRDLWRLTVTLMALQMLGHVGLRVVGPKAGLVLSGLVSGFISSTATIAAMGAKAREEPGMREPYVAAALASNVATVLLMALVAASASVALLSALVLPLGAAGLTALVAVGVSWRKGAQAGGPLQPSGKVFKLGQTLMFAAMLTGIAAAVGWLTRLAPGAGALAVALAGFGDAHAAGGAVFALFAAGKLGSSQTALWMLLAMTTNSISKVAGAMVAGGFAYAWRVALGLLAMMGAGWLAWLVQPW